MWSPVSSVGLVTRLTIHGPDLSPRFSHRLQHIGWGTVTIGVSRLSTSIFTVYEKNVNNTSRVSRVMKCDMARYHKDASPSTSGLSNPVHSSMLRNYPKLFRRTIKKTCTNLLTASSGIKKATLLPSSPQLKDR